MTGSHVRRGRTNSVIDRSEGKALLAAEAEIEARALREARRRLATGRATRLSELGELGSLELSLLLDLVGEALSAQAT